MTFMFPYISPYVNLIWSTPANFSLANPSSFLFRLVNDDLNLIPIRTGCFFCLSSATCFFCFSLCFLQTASLKLSEANLTILFCFPFYPIGCALSIFLIIALRTIPVSFSMVVATFCNSSSSPGFTKPLMKRHGHCEYSSSSPTFLLRYEMVFCCSSKMPSPFTFSCLSSVETGAVDVGVIVGFLA